MAGERECVGSPGRLVVRLDGELLDYLDEASETLGVPATWVVSEAIAFHALMMRAWAKRGEVVVSEPGEIPYQLASRLAGR